MSGRRPRGSFHHQYGWLKKARNSMENTLLQFVVLMATNPMVDCFVQSVWLQLARNPMADTQVQ